ncbi:receptor-type guanylate cyclase Gyc76C-like isoform X1 [Daphnia pulicaria]|uniref:receptor-type guanylate cyclase Gyc76C-like isoform X1 n=2 Tax=Daphnia pulicaria TaxID=35523 RepID=UPI001EEBD71C|nr:receptor-type guanylate cyclase Gyc76C-like isoform X1 [Daphnia pulicaria]
MNTDGGFLISSLLGIWLIGPIGICFVSLSILIMCFWRVEANVVKPETLIVDTKDCVRHHQNKFSSQSGLQRFDFKYSCNKSNHCSRFWVKPVLLFKNKPLELPQRLRKNLGLLRNMHHTNINPFIGAIFEDNKLYLITPYCILGSLQDVLSDASISFRKSVIISMIQDLISGLAYIHHSPILCHGHLKSSNCLVNSYFRLKVSDFGINRLRELNPNKSPAVVDRLWLAPELLRNERYYPSCQADIYAFAVILHEIIHRQGPFNVNATPSVDVGFIVSQIRQSSRPNIFGRSEYFRPQIKDDSNIESGCPFYIRCCLEDCWQEKPNMRPNIDEVFCRLSLMRNETDSQMVFQNEDDELVALQNVKDKKSRLLSSIIPSHAANQLVKGLRVKPQFFESVTLLFTNICNFRRISETSSPHEHVRMLDDLYNLFDSVVQGYRVYKVETVKDTYFVASGLVPQENHHTVEAALLALHLLNSFRSYTIPHCPSLPVYLRIGMHLGPVAAGVIGLDKPRFCLFGDTVNMTSRLSTTGEPSQIQISSECHIALVKTGGFITKERDMTYIKGKGRLKTYWLLGTQPKREVERI